MIDVLVCIYGFVAGIGVGIGTWAMWTNRRELAKESLWAVPCLLALVFLIAALWPIWLVALVLDSA